MEGTDDERSKVSGQAGPRARRPLVWTATIRARGQRLAEQAQAQRRPHGSVDAVFEMADRDIEVGGGIIAGALAYRLFIWLLPFVLVVVAGLGIAADSASQSPEHAASSLGLAGLVSTSVASSATSSTRWYALLVGIPALLLATRSVLRVLIGAHRLVWTDARSAAPKPTMLAAARLLALLLAGWVMFGVTSAVRERSSGVGLLATLLTALVYGGLWLLVTIRLPHRGAPWPALLPGAALFAFGVEVFHLVTVYLIARWALAKQGTYGALGIAAALLVGLYLLSRLMVATAVLNATLWERRTRKG